MTKETIKDCLIIIGSIWVCFEVFMLIKTLKMYLDKYADIYRW